MPSEWKKAISICCQVVFDKGRSPEKFDEWNEKKQVETNGRVFSYDLFLKNCNLVTIQIRRSLAQVLSFDSIFRMSSRSVQPVA